MHAVYQLFGVDMEIPPICHGLLDPKVGLKALESAFRQTSVATRPGSAMPPFQVPRNAVSGAASYGVVARWSTARDLVTVGGKCVVADLADGLVEVPDRCGDALPGRVRGQLHRHVQAEPDVEEAGDDGVELFQASVRLLS
jgi:hypothetical protein